MHPDQLSLFGETTWQAFQQWKQKDGARHVLQDMHRMASRYARRFLRTGQRVSIRLLWEVERDRIREVRMRLKKASAALSKWRGYTLNNNRHCQVSRRTIDRHPDWDGMFEKRETGKRKPTRAVVVPIRQKAG